MSNLKRGNWSTHELERLRSLYPKSPEAHVARLLRRSVSSVNRKARELFGSVQAASTWTAGDELRLREGYGVLSLEVLSLVLGRAVSDVEARIELLRTKQRSGEWSRMELGLLKKIYGSRTDQDLSVCLSRSLDDIRASAENLRLSKDKGFLARSEPRKHSMPRWGDADISFLRENYPRLTNLDLARQLHRSVASVANKANQLGLRKDAEVLREMGRRNVATRYRRPEGES